MHEYYVGFLENNTFSEGEGETESQRTWRGWSYLNCPSIVSVGLQCLIIFVMCYDCLCSCSSYILLLWIEVYLLCESIEGVCLNTWDEFCCEFANWYSSLFGRMKKLLVLMDHRTCHTLAISFYYRLVFFYMKVEYWFYYQWRSN